MPKFTKVRTFSQSDSSGKQAIRLLRPGNKKEEFFDLAGVIKRRNLMKITPQYVHPHKHLFTKLKKANILNTSLSWIYHYRNYLRKTDEWDLMLTISEKGRFLNQDIRDEKLLKDKKLELILSSFDLPEFPDIPDNPFKKIALLSSEPLFLPWWLHNQHMVLFLKRRDDQSNDWRKNWSLQEGFYYQSRLLSRRINPVHVAEDEDKEVLLYIFANYWYRAKEYTAGRPVPVIKDMEEMEKHVNDLLKSYDQ